MTPEAATAHAARYHNIWRGGVTHHELVDTFTDLDDGTLGTTLIRLRASEEHPPTIARIMSIYRTLNTATEHPTGSCARCDNGAITAWLERDGRWCRHSFACTCPAGRAWAWLGTLPTAARLDDPSA